MVSRGLYVNRTSGGRYHVRVGSTKRDLTPPELARLFQQRGREYVFDEQAVRTATVDDLNRNRLEAFFGRSPTIPWGIALPQQVRQGHAVEGGNRPAHHRRNAVALEMVHEQVGRGGQVRDRAAALRGHAAPPPFSDRLSAHAEQAGRLGLTQAPLKAGNASERLSFEACPSTAVMGDQARGARLGVEPSQRPDGRSGMAARANRGEIWRLHRPHPVSPARLFTAAAGHPPRCVAE